MLSFFVSFPLVNTTALRFAPVGLCYYLLFTAIHKNSCSCNMTAFLFICNRSTFVSKFMTFFFSRNNNLQKRLREYKDSHLLFLYDSSIPTNNNLCERLLRQLKRKLRQMMTFRSFESLEYYCTSLGLLGMLRRENKNLYKSVSEIF